MEIISTLFKQKVTGDVGWRWEKVHVPEGRERQPIGGLSFPAILWTSAHSYIFTLISISLDDWCDRGGDSGYSIYWEGENSPNPIVLMKYLGQERGRVDAGGC